MPVGFAHLTNKIIHVGIEPHVQQNGGINPSFFDVSGREIRQIGKAVQKMCENSDRSPVH
jgi:hypothetical protein